MTIDSRGCALEITAGVSSPRIDVDPDQRWAEIGDVESIPEDFASTVNALFAVGLDLAAIRTLVDDVAGTRIDRAIEKIDAAIAVMRSQTFASVREHDSAATDCAGPCRW